MIKPKYQGIYRIESTRLQNWDYGWSGAYFITICTKNRNHYFGTITNEKIELSPMGIIADIICYEIKHHFDSVVVDEYIIMPNHIHLLIILKNIDTTNNIATTNGERFVELRHALTLQTNKSTKTIGQQRFQNQGKRTISSIIGSFKSAVTKHIHRLNIGDFAWQSRFYDVIIRDEKSYHTIKWYIRNNPKKWTQDTFSKENS